MGKVLEGLDLDRDYIDCFKDHILKITELEGISVYDFAKRDSNDFGCRLVLDGSNAYFTGDIGSFIWSWYGPHPITLEKLAGFGMYYFSKKMICGTDIENEWNSDLARREFRERITNDDYYDNHKLAGEVLDEMEYYFEDEIEYIHGLRGSSIEELDQDYWEWAYNIGKQTPTRYYLWLLAIRLMQDKVLV